MNARIVDCRGMRCPLPIIESAKIIRTLAHLESFTLQSDDPATQTDLLAWARMTGHKVESLSKDEFKVTAIKPTA